MNKQSILTLAGECGFDVCEFTGGKSIGKLSVFDSADVCIYDKLKQFSAEVARIEREECAKLCEENCAGYQYGSTNSGPCLTEFSKESGGRHDGMTYAAAIRSKA